MHRRDFLSRSLMAVAAAGFAPRSWGAEGELSLGFSLYGMKTLPLDEALRACAEAGYKNVELALNAGWPTEPKALSPEARKELRRNLDALRLDVSALMLNMSLAVDDAAHAKNLEALREAAQLAHDLYPEHPPLVETVLGGKPAEWEKLKEGMAARLNSWAETASAAKIMVAIKAHVGSAVNSPDRLLWLLEQAKSPAICVAYDYSHFEVQGIPMEESMRALIPHARFVHVKDSAGDTAKFQFLLPGQGRTDYGAYFKLLKSLDYHGPVVVEVSAQVFNKPGYDPVAAAQDCYGKLAAAMKG